MTRRVMMVEDSATIAEGIGSTSPAEVHVEVPVTGERGLALVRRWDPHLVILDLMLPGMEGYALLRTLRDEGRDVPVLILSARGSEADRLRGFRLGADDYVAKPFSLPELLARVAAMLRRHVPDRARRPRTWRSAMSRSTALTRGAARRQ